MTSRGWPKRAKGASKVWSLRHPSWDWRSLLCQGRLEESADRLGKPLQDVVRHLEADLGGELRIDEAVDGDADQPEGGVDRHVDVGERRVVLVQERLQMSGHLAGQVAKRFRRRTGIPTVAKRQQLLTLQLPEPAAVGRDGAAELALNRPNPLEAIDSNLAGPAATRFRVAEGAGRIPTVSLWQRLCYEV